MKSTSDLLTLVFQHWERLDVPLQPGASQEELDWLAAQLGVGRDSDILEFYARRDGMDWLGLHDRCVNFWSIASIREELDEFSTPGELPFADFLCHSFTFDFISTPTGVLVRGSDPEVIGTFGRFLELYLTDPMKLCVMGEPV